METLAHTYCLILAGGAGRRLWPISRAKKPKQFIDFFGTGRTLLQQTYDRFVAILPPENIYVSTFVDYIDMAKEQLPDVPMQNFLLEPTQLSTGPATLWGSALIHRTDPQATLIISPCDQLILHPERFKAQLINAVEHVAETADILFLGATPTAPNSNYGYIQKDQPTTHEGIYGVKSFSEKPDAEFAELFVSSGEFLWNTGMLLWRTDTMAQQLPRLMPILSEQCEALDGIQSMDEWRQLIDRYYPVAPFSAIDLLLLDRAEGVRVMETNFGWADIGSWPELHEAHKQDADGNAVMGESKVLFNGSRDNTVYLPEGMAAVVKGLEGFLVASQGNVLVICPNNNASHVRQLLTEAQVQLGEHFM